MFSSRFFHILFLALAIGYVAHASVPIPARLAYRALAERQASEDPAGTDLPSDVSSAPVPTSTPPPEEQETTTSVEVSSTVPTSAPQEPEPTSAPSEDGNEETSAPPQQTVPSASRTNTQGAPAPTTTGGSRTTSGGNAEPAETSTTSHSVIISTSYEVRTTTLEDGTRQTMTSATEVTTTPGLNDGGESDRESGMSATTRNTIIGVSVGVGGAIILGALAVVFWRLRGRKKQAEEADGLMAYDNTYGQTDKSERSSSPTTTATSQQRNPFQSTLENYHQPTPVNPSSNF